MIVGDYMLDDALKVIERLKKETNYLKDIIYRKMETRSKDIYIIYNEPLTSSDKISDFVIRSLTNITKSKGRKLLSLIENDLSNYKVIKFNNYDDLCKYLQN